MKTAFTILLIWCNIITVVQSTKAQEIRLGYTSQQIKNEFENNSFIPENGFMYDKNNSAFFSILFENYMITYSFMNDTCTRSMLFPNSDIIVNKLINHFNENYVIDKSNTFWSNFTSNGKIKINFVQGSFFLFYE